MKVYISNQEFWQDIKTYLSVFLEGEEAVFIKDKNEPCDIVIDIKDTRITVLYYEDSEIKYETSVGKEYPEIKEMPAGAKEKRVIQKRIVRGLLYDLLSKISDVYAPWGILTGIRPTKVVYQLVEKHGRNKDLIASILKHKYRINEEKVNLLINVVGISGEILEKNEIGDCSVYIGIPFCPSTCAYCSFTSYPIGRYKDKVSDYLDALGKEIKTVSEKILPKRKLKSIYIGGGTPTTLNDLQLEKLMRMIDAYFDKSELVEFTVEAGRPDTITRGKLEILKDHGVNRISINPQTMTPETLEIIGRNHSVDDIYKAMEVAKSVGFNAINMDIIVGLPNEFSVDVHRTIEKVMELSPENITVHTLATKRAAKMNKSRENYPVPESVEVKNMLSIVYGEIDKSDYQPYYLYRQKNIASNLENVGFAKPGKESYYNVQIIDEIQDIIALGAGVTSKKVDKNCKMNGRLENVKDVYQYIDRIDEICKDKVKFYN